MVLIKLAGPLKQMRMTQANRRNVTLIDGDGDEAWEESSYVSINIELFCGIRDIFIIHKLFTTFHDLGGSMSHPTRDNRRSRHT